MKIQKERILHAILEIHDFEGILRLRILSLVPPGQEDNSSHQCLHFLSELPSAFTEYLLCTGCPDPYKHLADQLLAHLNVGIILNPLMRGDKLPKVSWWRSCN